MLDFGKRNRSGRNGDDSDDLFAADRSFDSGAAVEAKVEDIPVDDEPKSPAASEVEKAFGSPAKKKRARAAKGEADKMESARLLEEARCRMGISAADVEEITKIRSVYINALEQGNFSELPQPVYTLAYIRRLCELYALSAEEQARIIEPWSELSFETPDNYSTTVYSDESGDNRKVIRKLEAVIFSVIVLAVLSLVVFGIILLISFIRGNTRNDGVTFDEAEIVKVQPVPQLKVTEPVPQTRR